MSDLVHSLTLLPRQFPILIDRIFFQKIPAAAQKLSSTLRETDT